MIVGWRQAGLWEAGANPALPRNCKRGHRNRSLGKPEKDNLGRPVAVTGCWAKVHLSDSSHPDSSKPGDRREPSPKTLSRAKEDGMRHSGFLLVLFFSISAAFISAALAADAHIDLHIKVVDPNSAAVAGAQVSIYRQGETSPLQVRSTSGEGEALFHLDNATGLRAQVLAPGFAVAWSDVESASSSATLIKFQIALQIAAASETVIVSATRTPAPE